MLKKSTDSSNINQLTDIREQLKKLDKKWTDEGMEWGYKYTGKVYREISMQNSDFGGMENVGNTTITANRIMPFPDMTDHNFEYMIDVKLHEFYHNLNGSEVTGWSPFEIWLNEAVTVFITNKYLSSLFGEDYIRLSTLMDLIAPVGGTFVMDENPASIPIEPDGFNDPNELITSVTYVKAPEFVRMIEVMLGEEQFAENLADYHQKFKHSNATSADWLESMQKTLAPYDLQRFAQVWLKQTGYPKVHVKSVYDSKNMNFEISLRQEGYKEGMHWEFPVDIALMDSAGNETTSQIIKMTEPQITVMFKQIPEKPAFLSINRGMSFYGKVFHETNEEELILQVRKDSDIVNRYIAFKSLAEVEKMKILTGTQDVPSEKFVDIYFEILSNEELMDSVGSMILAIFEYVEDEEYRHEYQKLYECKKKILSSIATKYQVEILKMYERYQQKELSINEDDEGYVVAQVRKIKARQVKNLCLALLAKLDREEDHLLIKKQLEESQNATDQTVALSLYLNSSAKDNLEVLKIHQKKAKENLVRWERFLRVVGGNDNPEAIKLIHEVENSSDFRIEQTNDQSGLYMSFMANRKLSMLTAQGREFSKEILSKLAPINEYSTIRILTTLGDIHKLPREHKEAWVNLISDIFTQIDAKKLPSVAGVLERMLRG